MIATPLGAASLTGRVEVRNSKDPAVNKKKDYSGVVVWLEGAGAPVHPGDAPHARMLQKDKMFTPHLLAIQAGDTVDFPNLDPIFHNAFSNYDGKVFDVGLYPPGSSRSVRFTRPGVVRVFCNIHANMSAVIVVLNSSRFALTGKDGAFTMEDVPPGEYTLHVFHERATAPTLDAITRRISVSGGAFNVPAIAISETGYLPVPHKDKFGRDYTAAPDEHGIYPATRK